MKKDYEVYFCMLLEEDIHLTHERMQHILYRHEDISDIIKELNETLILPNFILQKMSGELLLVKWHPGIFNGKYIVVVVKPDPGRIWILTAFLSSRLPVGDLYEY